MIVKGQNSFPKKSIQNILLIQLGDLGDVVLTIPCIRALRENFPDSNIVVAVRDKAKDLLVNCPWHSSILAIEQKSILQHITFNVKFIVNVRRQKFDLSIDMRTESRGTFLTFLSGAKYKLGYYMPSFWRDLIYTNIAYYKGEKPKHISQYHLQLLNDFQIKTNNNSPQLLVLDDYKNQSKNILTENQVSLQKPIVAIQPFSLWQYKELPIHLYVIIIKYLIKTPALQVIITGSKNDYQKTEDMIHNCGEKVFNLTGKTTLAELPGILELCSLFISIDSAGIHIAAAVNTPTVSFFGPSSPISWAPVGDQHVVIQKNLPCVPCYQKGCQNSQKSKCLDDLCAKEILPIIEKRLSLLTTAKMAI